MKRIAYLLLLSLLVVGCSSEPKVKYVFYFIGDGMGVNEVIGTNLYNQANGQENVNFTSFPVVNFITTVPRTPWLPTPPPPAPRWLRA